ncbi:hypothetical protein [Microbacterium marinilacus]|uniref:Uncharacterized protein n=1 Tax=Microbacterium marinilacus TaxID=415209 RepID=A0ABP7B2F2_9MICO|nr:hypothetical protein [Microbacterium marinilacus]MBY0688546.1 hypothetical protein [Microbacterium marinilacus]
MDGLKLFRRVAIWAIVGSLSVAAVIGITVILTGAGGELEFKVMGTTAMLGALGVLVLCDLVTFGRPLQWIGIAGLPVAVVAFFLGVVLIWAPDAYRWDGTWRSLWVSALLSVALAHAALISRFLARPHPAVRTVVLATLVTIAGYAFLGGLPIVVDDMSPGDGYLRTLWVVVILCVLGTIVSPVIGAILRERPDHATRVVVDLPPALLSRIDAAGARDEVVVAALHRAFPAPPARDEPHAGDDAAPFH